MLHKSVCFLISVIVLPIIAYSNETATNINIATLFRVDNTFNSTNYSLKGIHAAKHVFEQDHPGIRINIDEFFFSSDAEFGNLGSIHDEIVTIVHNSYPAVIGGEMSDEALIISSELENKNVVFFDSYG